MIGKKSTFALYFGNRGFFPASLMESARREMADVMARLGHDYIILDAAATRNGAVETAAEGAIYAQFLKENEGKFDGVTVFAQLRRRKRSGGGPARRQRSDFDPGLS